jgi:hypothetical protein
MVNNARHQGKEPMEGLTYTALLLVFAGTHGLALKQFA